MLEKPKLFLTLKQFWLSMIFLIIVIFIRLFILYDSFKDFKFKPFFYTEVEVLQAYEKRNKNNVYTVLKVYSPVLNLTFFSSTKIRVKELSSKLRLRLSPSKKMKFREYLGTSFIQATVNEIIFQKTYKSYFLDWVREQHSNVIISNFYNAIFFAEPLEKPLRKSVSSLGISHLIALSGFHLAILSSVLFFLLRPFYSFFQQKYFPYRFDLLDIGLVVLLILASYVWFVGSPASLLRSYLMLLMGWLFLLLGVELITLSFLSTVTLILLVIFPKLLLSVAFWFSIVGVFYIFLIIQHFSELNKYLLSVLISAFLFILLLPIVHTFFSLTTILQLLSPFLSLIFSIFYPLVIALHILGIGGVFDGLLLKLFYLHSKETELLISFWWAGSYLLLSFLAFYSKKIFYLLLLLSFGFFGWLFMGFLL